MLRKNSHWPEKFFTKACERGSASMRWTCCRKTDGSLSRLFSAKREQLVVGNAAPQEKRQAGGKSVSLIREQFRRRVRRIEFDAEYESGDYQEPPQCELDARLEAAVAAP